MTAATEIFSTEEISSTILLTFASEKPFNSVVADLEAQLGRLDQESSAQQSPENLPEAIKQMEGSSGLMIVAMLEMDKMLPSLIANERRARQYLIGNPLVASAFCSAEVTAALYAPPRVLVFSTASGTAIAYDKPSSVFEKFPSIANGDGAKLAKSLDEKFERLARNALS